MNIDRFTEDMVTQISLDPQKLLAFAYELRKQDGEDRYSYELLNGQVRPHVLVTIICSNKWNEQRQEMETKPNAKKFQLSSAINYRPVGIFVNQTQGDKYEVKLLSGNSDESSR